MNFQDSEEIRMTDNKARCRCIPPYAGDQHADIRIVIADDHPVVTCGVRHVLDQSPAMHVVAEVHTVTDIMQQLDQHACDVLVCDYSFDDDPEPDGLRMIERIKRTYPNVKIVLLTMLDDQCLLRHIIQRGVSAFLSKTSNDLHELPRIILSVMQGKTYIDTQIASSLLFNMLERPLRAPTHTELSARELEVVRLYEEGMTVADIATRLNRSRKTITTQKASAMKKLGVASNQALVDAVRKIL
ncbi:MULTISPECIES: response regulator transcription factor [Burkholderia cepacia complex]|uniref:response regulator transcription factor n=1 Tax=Burkholderia cepacia complex TaxID=87882 RepID=UPI0015E2A449|nr:MULTISPECIES: response regulator transcription factor [Burkholderia cepacia complex]MBR8383927.1 response regulator transcription factor [Burkholderia cenocepacia]MBR8434908.1 response regulator transcription factor [Burkholderia cenocepacia]MCO1366480.1 response regulator transcription factor [Burkholderia multivorans]MCO1376089.1 response regulator transcription factor [Burkholderia multivorans]UQP21103.1 response regulator transcription factor [Burkholderia multivorans]